MALDEISDACDTAQLLIFLRGITPHFEITEELASVQSMKSTTTGKYLLQEVNNCVAKLGLSFIKRPTFFPVKFGHPSVVTLDNFSKLSTRSSS